MQLPDFLAQITTPTPCRNNPDMWYGESRTARAKAKQWCRACPVRGACAAWALPRPEEEGIWGGTDERDRRVWRRAGRLPRRPRPPAAVPGVRRGACGTVVAFRRHQAASVECAVCREALMERVRDSEGHGTASMYRLELLLDVERCAECREWCRAKSASQRAQRAVVAPETAVAARGVAELPTGRQAAAQPFGKAA